MDLGQRIDDFIDWCHRYSFWLGALIGAAAMLFVMA